MADDNPERVISGKGVTLEYIRSKLPDVPIPPFVRVPAVVDTQPTLLDKLRLTSSTPAAREEQRLAKEIGYPLIVRSDAKYEDGLGRSFAGLFTSLEARHESELAGKLRIVRENSLYAHSSGWPKVESYARSRGVCVMREPIDVLFQRYISARARGIITEHPNVPDAFFFDIERTPEFGRPKRIGLFFRNIDEAVEGLSSVATTVGSDAVKALTDYLRVREQFPKTVAYQAEVLLGDYAFVQWRPFRKKEAATFDLDELRKPTKAVDIDVVLGVTPPEGILCTPQEWLAGIRVSQTRIPENPSPSVSFFMKEPWWVPSDWSPFGCAPWQSHDLFRFFEQGSHVCFAAEHEHTRVYCMEGNPIRYWSDGRKGRVAPVE